MASRIGRLGRLWALGLAAACGYSDAGDGSKTVTVVADFACRHPELISDISVQLWRDGQPLQDANVTLFDPDSHETVTVPTLAELGHYGLRWPGYHRRVRAHIWQERDGMTFQVEGPSPHTIQAPQAGALVARTAALPVRWATPDGVRADEVTVLIDGDKSAHRRGTDGGKVRFSGREFGQGQHQLTVIRSQVLRPQGAAGDSTVSHRYAVSLPFFRLP